MKVLGAQALIKTRIPKRQIWKGRSAVVGTNGKEAVPSSPRSFHLKDDRDMGTSCGRLLLQIHATTSKIPIPSSQDKIALLSISFWLFNLRKRLTHTQFISILCEKNVRPGSRGSDYTLYLKTTSLSTPSAVLGNSLFILVDTEYSLWSHQITTLYYNVCILSVCLTVYMLFFFAQSQYGALYLCSKLCLRHGSVQQHSSME